MTAIPWFYATNPGVNANLQTEICTFFKLGGTPGADTTIWDINFGITGFIRLKVTPTLHVIAEQTLWGAAVSSDLNGGTAISSGAWYWGVVSLRPAFCYYGNHIRLSVQLWGPGGITIGEQVVNTGVCEQGNSFFSGEFGWGKSVSSGYNDWPNSPGWELSKGLFYKTSNRVDNYNFNDTITLSGPPSSDLTPDGNYTALWLCRDALGARSVILDSTSNHYDLTGTMTVVTDGPYP